MLGQKGPQSWPSRQPQLQSEQSLLLYHQLHFVASLQDPYDEASPHTSVDSAASPNSADVAFPWSSDSVALASLT